jgi:hypothetical protein
MRAIGKRSLASILAAGLHVVRFVLFFGFIGLSVAAVAVPLLPLALPLIDRVPGVDAGSHLHVSGGGYVEIMSHFASFGVMLFVVNRLLEILRTLRLGSPFVRENSERFRQVGFALLLGEAAKIAFMILSEIFDGDVELKLEPTNFIAVMAVFVLAEVFRQGARMKEEQDLTV